MHFRDQPDQQFDSLEALVAFYTKHAYAKDGSGANHCLRAPDTPVRVHACAARSHHRQPGKRKTKFF